MAERIKIAVAALIAAAGLIAFTWLAERQPMVIRLGVLFGSFAAAIVIMWFTAAGRTFLAFARESWEEAKRVVWPTRKETLQTTAAWFALVFRMPMFLWRVEPRLRWFIHRLPLHA